MLSSHSFLCFGQIFSPCLRKWNCVPQNYRENICIGNLNILLWYNSVVLLSVLVVLSYLPTQLHVLNIGMSTDYNIINDTTLLSAFPHFLFYLDNPFLRYYFYATKGTQWILLASLSCLCIFGEVSIQFFSLYLSNLSLCVNTKIKSISLTDYDVSHDRPVFLAHVRNFQAS